MYYDYEPEYIKEERKREAERNRFLTRHSDLQHSLQYPSSDHHKDEEIDLSFYGNGARIPVDRKEELLRVLIHLKKHPYAKRIVFPDVKIENNTVSGIEIEVESRFCELLIHSPNIIQINNCQDLFQDEKSSLAKLVKINRKIGEYLDPKKNCHFLNFQNLLFVDAVTPTLNRILKAIKENDSVRELNLMNAALTSAHVPVLCEILRSSKNLVSFSIGSKSTVDACQNKLTNEDIKLLLAAIRENPDSPLQYLDISYNNVKPGLVEDVVVFLKEHKKITYLNLAGCSVDDSGMKILSEYLKINTVLSVLNLDANLFQGPGLLFLLDALKVNRCICELSLLTNQVPEATVESFIKELATVNRAIHDLKMTHVSHQPKRSYREKNIDYPMRIKTALGHFNDTNKTLSDRAVVSAMSGSLDDFIQKLIQRISPYIKNGEGKSLLQILVENEHLGHIAYLRSQGFYMDLLTPELVSMLDYAKSLNKSEVTNVLRGAASIINSSRLAFPPSPSLTATSPNTAKGKKHARAETDPKQQTLFGAWARDEAKRAKKATDPTPTNSLSEQAPVILPVPTAAAPENNTDTDVQSYAKFYYAVCYWQLNIIR
ncbi:MAG: hypothetical protein JSS53_06845, partial [Proteobacteria bacterium]|nr:hypothetical protein [Pseudomonadota bacterium]